MSKNIVKPVVDITNFPTIEHFAVIVFKTMRTREDDYHGGTFASSYSYCEYIPFTDQLELEKWILQEDAKRDPKKYQVIQVSPLSVKKSISIEINLPTKLSNVERNLINAR